MKAIIMAGGSGTRLRPMTCTMPKPMVKLLNKPVIDYCVELLVKHGFTDITVTLQYMSDSIKAHLGDGSSFGAKISYSVEDTPLGTAGSVKAALKDANERALVISGDAMCDIDLKEVWDAHIKTNSLASIVLKKIPSPVEYGVAIVGKDGRIKEFIEKPHITEVFSDLVNTGVYVLEPEAIDMIPEGRLWDFSKDLFPKLLADERGISGIITEKYWCDIGDAKSYIKAQMDMLDGKCDFDTKAHYSCGFWIEPDAQISSEAKLIPPCYIASGVEIGPYAAIDAYTVLCNDVKIEHDTGIKRSVLLNNAHIRHNCEVRGAIICENTRIGANVAIYEGAVIGAKTHIERGAIISPHCKIWPEKSVEPGRQLSSNLMWGEGRLPDFTPRGVCGYADNELTPESITRLAASFGAAKKDISRCAIACDGTLWGVMLKQAALSGLMSQGIDVFDLGSVSESAFSYSIRRLTLDGGIFIECGIQRSVRIGFYDTLGLPLDRDAMRSFSKRYEEGEQRPVTNDEIGIMQRMDGMGFAYEAELMTNMSTMKLMQNPFTVIIAAPDRIGDTIASMLIKCGYTVYTTTPLRESEKRDAMRRSDAALYLYASSEGEAEVTLDDGTRLDRNSIMAIIALDNVQSGIHSLVVPFEFPDQLCQTLHEHGVDTIPAGDIWEAERRAYSINLQNHREYFDPEAMLLKVCELASASKLKQLTGMLPSVKTKESTVACDKNSIGSILRSLTETESNVEFMKGVKIHADTGWVIVRPDEGMTACRIISGSYNQEYADDLCDIYSKRVRQLKKK